jgi:hypothetical protein
MVPLVFCILCFVVEMILIGTPKSQVELDLQMTVSINLRYSISFRHPDDGDFLSSDDP